MEKQPMIQDYIMTFLQRPDVVAHFLFITFSLHPMKEKDVMGWSIDAKLRTQMPDEFEEFLSGLQPFRKVKSNKDGCWVLYWKGFYSLNDTP